MTSIVGYINYGGVFTPVLWSDTNVGTETRTLNLMGGTFGIAYGINNLGQIVGFINYAGVETPVIWPDTNVGTEPRPLIFTGGTNGVAFGINSLGQIVGFITYGGVQTPVIWPDTNVGTAPRTLNYTGGSRGNALGINTLGQIVGTITYGGVQTPVIWPDTNVGTAPRSLTFTGGSRGVAYGINSLGQIVGFIRYGGVLTPVIWPDTNVGTEARTLNLTGGTGTLNAACSINSLGQIVGFISYGVLTPVIWPDTNVGTEARSLTFTGGNDGQACGINDPPTPPVPISNICFPAGTPVQTDQGLVNIELLDPRTHTINATPIVHVTRTTTLDKYLLRFKPHALGRNVPHTTTLMTRDHKIMFEDRLVPAYRFLDYSDQVKKVKYTGETLYNVLLAGYGVMKVNNLICETLHPENIIAKLYTTNYTVAEQDMLVYQLNTALKQKDLVHYKAVVDKLNTTF